MKHLFILLFVFIYSCSGNNSQKKLNEPGVKTSGTAEKNSPAAKSVSQDKFTWIEIDPSDESIHFFWKNGSGEKLKTLPNLKSYLDGLGKELVFAMNAGIYTEDFSPLGLYIEDGRTVRKINSRTKGYGNFYIQPGGIFSISNKNKASITKHTDFSSSGIRYATQSGPMLVINRKINDHFDTGSVNRNIRNGVGIMENGNVLLAISADAVTFFEFAEFFRKAGCVNALYLDGGISEAYYPEKEVFPFFNPGFGVMIGVVKNPGQ